MNDLLSSNMLAVVGIFIAGVVLGSLIIMKANKQPDAHRDTLAKGFSSNKPAPQVSSRRPSMDSIEGEVADLVRAGNTIEAIKRLRAVTGMDLAQAKDTVDRLKNGQRMKLTLISTEPTGDMETIHQLLRENRKIDAIKELRSQTGLGLSEAKGVIDKMCADNHY